MDARTSRTASRRIACRIQSHGLRSTRGGAKCRAGLVAKSRLLELVARNELEDLGKYGIIERRVSAYSAANRRTFRPQRRFHVPAYNGWSERRVTRVFRDNQ